MKDDVQTMAAGGESEELPPPPDQLQQQKEDGEIGSIMSRLETCEEHENWREVWNPRFSMATNNTKGLLNAPGQNNCFLNSAVQVLWHLDVFRRSFRLLSGHACMGNSCIFCALKVIFTQIQYSDQSALPPDSLRKALAKSFYEQRRFQQGHMDDAAECFENILTRIHFHVANEESEDTCKAKHCISHQKFSMQIVEQIVCQCGATAEPLPFSQTVQYVSAKALVNQAKLVAQNTSSDPAQNSFAQLLRLAVSEGDVRNCPSKCGKKLTIRRNLTNVPAVVSIGLIWDTDRPSLQYVNQVLQCIGTELNLDELFKCTSPDKASLVLRLQGVVCYYGKHYSTFFFHSKMKKWTYFDDAHVKELDSRWSSVTDKCLRGHYQPLLLLYSTENCQPISTETAPQKTTMLPGYQTFSSPDDYGYYGHQGYYHAGTKSRLRGHPKYVKYESQYRRSMTPNPDLEHQRQEGYEMAASLRRAITPGPEMNGHYDAYYHNSDDEAHDRQQVNGAHFRQASYLTAMDRVNTNTYNQGHYDGCSSSGMAPRDSQSRPPGTADPRKPRMYGGQSQQYVSHNEVQYQHPRYDYPADPQYHAQLPHQVAHPEQMHSSYPDWTLSNHSQYRRPQGIPPASATDKHLPPNMPVQPVSQQPVPTDTLAKVNEIQRVESFKKGNAIGADVIRYQYANETDSQKMMTMSAADAKKAAYKKFGSMADLSSEARRSHTPVNHQPHVTLQRTRSLENALEAGCDTGKQPLKKPASYNRPLSQERPAQHPRPASAFEPVSTQSRSKLPQDVVDGRPPVHPGWQASKEDDNYGTYISRKTVESILSAQGIRAGLKKPSESNKELRTAHIAPDAMDNLSLNSHKDSGYRSGSASSASSVSAESLVIDTYRNQKEGSWQQHRSVASSESSISSTQSTVTVKQSEPPLPNKSTSSRLAQSRPQQQEDPYDHLPAHSGRPVQGQPLSLPQKKHPPDVECESLCIKAESLMEQSLEKERLGNLSSALAYCNLAIDELQQGLGIANCQPETRMYAKMKLNTCIMRSRSLHRRMMLQQQDPNSEDQTSISSLSTDPETRDYELNPMNQEALYMAQYSSDSGYSEHSDSGKTSHLVNHSNDSNPKTTADIYGTLPKKGSQKAKSHSVSAKDAEVYQAYLQRQKNLNKAQSHSALPRPSNTSQPPPYTAPQHIRPGQHMYPKLQNEAQYNQTNLQAHSQPPSHPSIMYQAQNPMQNAPPKAQPNILPTEQAIHQHQGSNSKMSKEEIRQLLYTDFVSKGKGVHGSHQGCKDPRKAYEELQDQMGHMTVRNQSDKVDGSYSVQPRGFAVFPPQMHPYNTTAPVQHSREGSASSSQTLQAHSRDSSLSTQPQHSGINAHLQAFMLHNKAEDEESHSQLQPPKPSEIGRMDKMKRQAGDIYNTRSWTKMSQPQYEQQPSPDMQVPRLVQKSTSQGALYSYQPGQETAGVPPQSADGMSGEQGEAAGSESAGQQSSMDQVTEDLPPPPAMWQDPPAVPPPPAMRQDPLAVSGSLQVLGADPSHTDTTQHIMTVQQQHGVAPVRTSSLSTFQRPGTTLVGGDKCRVGLPGQRTSTTSTTSYESNNTSNIEQNSNTETTKTPKSILKKRSRKKKDTKVVKSISFSDNIALIADVAEVAPEAVDYVAYVSNLEKNSPKAKQRSSSLPNDGKTGYDSDFDDDTSDSASSTDTAGENSRCNLCHKHVVQTGDLYCPDCSFYMSRLQPQES